MNDLYRLPTYNTIGGYTAQHLIDKANIVKTQSDDYLYRVGNYDLGLTDDDMLVVTDYGHGIGTMEITPEQIEKMESIQEQIESLYQKDNVEA